MSGLKITITELKEVPKDKYGRFYDNDAKLEAHEYSLALLLTRFGFTVEAIKPTNTPKNNNPDFLISGGIWEAKSPEGKTEKCIEHNFHHAGKQAKNLILDLRRIKIAAATAKNKALKEFRLSRVFRHMLLVEKDGKILEIKK